MIITSPGLRRAFVALEHRSFRLLFLSTIVSGIGGQLFTVSNLWQVYALTGSALHIGLTGLARAVPIILFSLVGGVVADRVDRKKIIILSQAASAVSVLCLSFLTAAGMVEVWHVYAATFLHAMLTSVSQPARRAIISAIVPRHHLVNAMALNSVVHQIDRILAPALAGVLIALVGLPLSYGVNGAAHLLTALTLSFVALAQLPSVSHSSPLRSAVEGLAFVRSRPVILALLASDGAAMLFGGYQVLLPILADEFGTGVAGFGLLSSAPAIGGLAGAIIVMYLGDFPYKGRLIVGGVLCYSFFLAGLAFAPSFALTFAMAMGLGMSDAMQAATRNALIQMLAPDALRGRVSSFQHMLTGSTPALGLSLMGAAAGVVSAPVALIAGAACCAAFNVGLLSTRRDLRARDLGQVPEVLARSG